MAIEPLADLSSAECGDELIGFIAGSDELRSLAFSHESYGTGA